MIFVSRETQVFCAIIPSYFAFYVGFDSVWLKVTL